MKISQFFGIEINDCAVTVAKTALWIAESQMIRETEAILSQNIDFLPLTTNAFIVEGNALRMDWATLKPIDANAMPANSLFSGFDTETDGLRHQYDYIIGNPPFVGARLMSDEQKNDIVSIFGNIKNVGNLDYVSCWYKKAADLIKNSKTKCALVSTNSITQGEQTAILWKPLFNSGIQIDFAWRTFRWDSESNQKAHVHCVIIGFSCANVGTSRAASENAMVANNADAARHVPTRRIFNADGTVINARNINPYLIDATNVFIEGRKTKLCNVPDMVFGSMSNDGGNFILTEEEKNELLKTEPNSEKYIRLFLGSEEYINNKVRYCLWLVGASPAELKRMPQVLKRIENVRKLRAESKRGATQKLADIPHLFAEIRQPQSGQYIIVPRVSSERRKYVPIGFLDYRVIASDAAQMIPNATLYHFGVLTSSVHNAWMRAVCGRLKSDYRYSANIVYNNFPWPQESENMKAKIEQTAQKILDARALYPDSSLADLYDETLMPPELRKAHRENDKAVMAAYGFDAAMDESEIVARLFELYEEMVKK